MYEKFLELPDDKQLKIINAALEVFSQNDYKHAITDDIAAKADISKGALFYYFHNKKSLYMYVYEYATDMMKNQIATSRFWELTDFFEVLEYASEVKVRLLAKNPYLMDFCMRSFYPNSKLLSNDLESYNQNVINSVHKQYFKNVDFSKFKDHIDPGYILNMFIWMGDGYLHQKKVYGQHISVEEIMVDFRKWMDMLKPLIYKEEYL